MKTIACIITSLIFTSIANAGCISPDKGFWNNPQGRGWFWGQGECQTDEDNISGLKEEWKLLPQKINIPWNILDKIDPEEIANKIEPEAKKISIMYPNDENISEYRKLTNWIVAKASRYATIDEKIRTENPGLMPGLEFAPISQIKNKALISFKNIETDQILEKYKNKAGIIIYESSSCSYCKLQKPIIEEFSSYYGWEILYRDIAQFRQEALRLNVKTTPDIFLVLKKETGKNIKYQRIATGLTTMDKLKISILKGLGYLGEEINETLTDY